MAFIYIRPKGSSWEFLSAWNDGVKHKLDGGIVTGNRIDVPGLSSQELIDNMDGRTNFKPFPSQWEKTLRAKAALSVSWIQLSGYIA